MNVNELKIIHSSDVHGYIYNHNYIKDEAQGLLVFYDYLKSIKQNYKNVLFLDAGDLIQGSPLTYYLNKNFNDNNVIIELLNDLNYDVVTLGNHEFNYGLNYLTKSYSCFNGKIVSANIDGLQDLNYDPYVIYTFNEKKIGIIGFTTSFVPNWEKDSNISGLKFHSIIETYKKYEKTLKEQTDFIIGLYHGGFESDINDLDLLLEAQTGENEASNLLKEFSSIDLLLTGHQHRDINTYINNTLCLQTLNNAKSISETTVDLSTMKITSNKINYAKDFVTNFDVEDINQLITPNISKTEKKVQSFLDTVIGNFDRDLIVHDHLQARLKSHALINFVNEVQLSISGADISCVSLFDSAVGFKKEITIRDLIANYPFPNTLVVLEGSKKDLLEAMKVSASYFDLDDDDNIVVNKKFSHPKPQHYNYDMFDGLNYDILINKDKENEVVINSFDKEVDQEKIKIVTNNYRATNYAWYPIYKELKIVKEIPFDMVELLINYISDNKNLKVNTKSKYNVIINEK